MRPGLTVLCAFALLGLPSAAADETLSDCEPGQMWVGYHSTESLRRSYADLGRPGGFDACEGEHWDGQDGVQSSDPGSTGPCVATHGSSREDLFVGFCQGPDVNAGPAHGPDPLASFTPAAARASLRGASSSQEAYLAANALFVGRVALYAGACEGAGGPGLEGAACGGLAQGRLGVYVRDNTPENLVWRAVSVVRLTHDVAGEGDCTQDEYRPTAIPGRPCVRDNTAVTVQFLLP